MMAFYGAGWVTYKGCYQTPARGEHDLLHHSLSWLMSHASGTTAASPRSFPVRRVVYVSRSLIDADDDALNAMIQHASTSNAAAGITGMLWFDGTNFAQVLEGDHNAVGETLSRIQHDPRHFDLDIVLDREVRARAFGEWGMIRPHDDPNSVASTAFLVGLSMAQRGPAAQRLHDIVVACEV